MVSQKVLYQYKNNGNEDLLQHQNAQTIVTPLNKNIYSKVCFEAKIVEQTSGSNAKFSKSSLALESTCLKKKVTSNKRLVSTKNKRLVSTKNKTQKCSNEILALTAQSYEEYQTMITICLEKSVAVKCHQYLS